MFTFQSLIGQQQASTDTQSCQRLGCLHALGMAVDKVSDKIRPLAPLHS